MALTKVNSVGIATGISLTGITTTQDTKVGTGITLSPDGDGYYTGIITATSYRGDVSNCTGVGQTNFIDAESLNVSGISTLNSIKVGTGITLSPDGDVYVTGVSTFAAVSATTGSYTGNVDIATDIRHIGDTDTSFRFTGEDTIVLQTGGTERFHVASDGKIGINSSTPSHSLDVYGTSNQYIKILKGDTQPVYFGNVNGASVVESTGAFFVKTAGSERARIDTSGRLLMGDQTTNYTCYADSKIQVGTNDSTASIQVTRWSADGSSPYLNLGKSRGAVGVYTIVQSGDRLGQINFVGADGTDMASHAASIAGYVDGTPGDNDMPGRLVFATSSDGGTSETERLRIDSAGAVILSNSFNSNTDITPALVIGSSSFSRPGIVIRGNSTNKGDISWCDNSGSDSSDGVSEGLIRYDHDGDYMCFHAADEERFRILATGYAEFAGASDIRVTFGSQGTAGTNDSNWIRADGENLMYNNASSNGAHKWEIGGSEAMRITGAGKLNVGDPNNTSYQASFSTSSTSLAKFESTKATDEGVEIQMFHNSASPADGDQTGYLQFSGDDSNGNGTIFNAIICYQMDVTDGTEDGEFRFFCRDNASFSQKLKIASDGTFTGSSSNDISDQRLKDNIATVVDPIGKIKALKGRTFTWKPEAKLPAGTKYGFIAQEVETVVSDLVDDKHGIRQFDKDGNLIPEDEKARVNTDEGTTDAKSVNAIGVVPILVEALKEALVKIETLETKVAALESS